MSVFFGLSQNAVLGYAVFKLLQFTQNIHNLHHSKRKISQKYKYSMVFGPALLGLVNPKL